MYYVLFYICTKSIIVFSGFINLKGFPTKHFGKKRSIRSSKNQGIQYFFIVRFALVFGWSMQFVVIEWQVYSLTKDPLSLGIIGLMEIIPALGMALFAGHIVDQKRKTKPFSTLYCCIFIN